VKVEKEHNMASVDTVKALIKLGVLIDSSISGKQIEWASFLSSPDFNNISSSVKSLTSALGSTQVQGLIDDINAKQAAILAGRQIEDLPVEDLIQYSKLGNVKLRLSASVALNSGNLAAFGSWLVKDALPVLLDAAPVIIPLLL
jgi:hypothetical protein